MTQIRLSPEDRVLLRADRDPRRRPTVGGLVVLTGTPDWGLVAERLDRASRVLAPLRARAVEPVVTTTEPRWVIDPDFHLDQHVRRVGLPAPGGHDELMALVECVVGSPFDPSGPLWTVTCVDGVGRGGSAIVTAMSPLLRTEAGPIDLLDLALDDSVDGAELPPLPVPTDLEPVDLARTGMKEIPMRAVALTIGGVTEVANLAVEAAADPRALVDRATALFMEPVSGRGSALIAGRGTARGLLTLTVPMSWVDQATGLRSVEPVHLAAVRAGLLRYHEALGLPQNSLDITSASHPAGLRRALAPVQDPVEALGRLLPLLPDGVIDMVARPPRLADIAVSHVDTTLDGTVGAARVVERYAVGPVPGNALTSVAAATPDAVFVTVRYDTAAIRDPGLLERCLEEGFADILGPRPKVPARARTRAAATRGAARKARS